MTNQGGFGNRIEKRRGLFSYQILKIIYPPSPFINCIDKKNRQLISHHIFKNGNRVLDVGSGISKGPGSWLWTHKVDSSIQILRLDICDGPEIDIVGDATNLPSDVGTFDAIVLQAVPEHIEDIAQLFQEMGRVLKRDGVLYVEMPFLQGVHGDPYDFWRTTPEGLRVILKQYKILAEGVSGGPVGSLVWIICDLFSSILTAKYLNLIIRFILRWILSPLRYIDLLLGNTKAASRLATENYILVQKR